MMDDITDAEKFAIHEDELQKKISAVVEEFLDKKTYDEKMIPHWVSSICENVIDRCLFTPSHKKPFKYVVTCAIMQRTGAAVHSANACHWDGVSDALIPVVWPNRKVRDGQNRTMVAIVNVFAVSLK